MWDSPEMLKIYRMICVTGIIYGIAMAVITGIAGYLHVRFMIDFMKPRKPPPLPPMPPLPKLEE